MSSSYRLSTAVKALCYLAKVFPEAKSSNLERLGFESFAKEKKLIDFDVADSSDAKDGETEKYNNYFHNFFWDIQKQIEERMQKVKLDSIKESDEK